ncbi:hypothetical protein NE237_007552 [Protea cynaroides]|uniref:Uncharacterized protein n=1 Tax=Protea cynaroides TaxID=273540 RepID=A0A9Q0KPH3_9MAGN|nr:hypothetical protein NE237_007552 [Protea cynaroides]
MGQVTITVVHQRISQGNEELRTRETTALAKVKELSKLLEEASPKEILVDNGELSDSEKDYDLLPRVVEFSVENGNGGKEEHMFEFPYRQLEEPHEDKDQETDLTVPVELKVENGNRIPKEGNEIPQERNGNPQEGNRNPQEEEKKKRFNRGGNEDLDNCKIGEKNLPPEKEPEQQSSKEDLDSKKDGENFDQVNGSAPSKSNN